MAPTAAASLVVHRDRPRRQRKSAKRSSSSRTSSSNNAHAVRRGFVFQDTHDDEHELERTVDAHVPLERSRSIKSAANGGSNSSDTFVFRVKKPQHTVDVSTASAALLSKKERAQKVAERRQRQLKQQREDALEAAYVQQLAQKLTPDQLWLYDMVRAQIKREVRKTNREFANSSARKDIVHLTETSLKALKDEMVAFMVENPPAETSTNLPNPENARLRALLDTYEKRISDLDDEEQQWLTVLERIETETSGVDDDDSASAATSKVPCALPIATEVDALQRKALAQIGATAQQLELVDDSVQSVDRLILQIEMKKAALFHTFRDAAFKGYEHMTQPKESLRALLKCAPPASVAITATALPPPIATAATDVVGTEDREDTVMAE